jgi:putative transcriptional regulator
MDEKLFDELLDSVKEAGGIVRGEVVASRVFSGEEINVKAVRERTGLSQTKFALTIGISVRTLQNWEQGHRQPQGPARALLTIFQNDPEHALRALHAE